VVFKSLFMRVGELSDICNRLDPEIALTIHFSTVLRAFNHFSTRINGTAPELDTVTPSLTYNLLV
jgi:hypothetical protein